MRSKSCDVPWLGGFVFTYTPISVWQPADVVTGERLRYQVGYSRKSAKAGVNSGCSHVAFLVTCVVWGRSCSGLNCGWTDVARLGLPCSPTLCVREVMVQVLYSPRPEQMIDNGTHRRQQRVYHSGVVCVLDRLDFWPRLCDHFS